MKKEKSVVIRVKESIRKKLKILAVKENKSLNDVISTLLF